MDSDLAEMGRKKVGSSEEPVRGGSSSNEDSNGGSSKRAGAKRKAEHSFVAAKSSIRLLHDVFSKFDSTKRGLVMDVGFGGLLSFPPLRQINRKFAVWVMSRVDPLTHTIFINEFRRIKFTKLDINRVFGIPCGGIAVYEKGMPSKEVISKMFCLYFGGDGKAHRSVKAAQMVIEREYGSEMTAEEKDSFKVAFVVYVMSTLLAPGGKFDCPSFDYWNALAEPDDIGKFDWADYVLRRLVDGVLKVKSDLEGNVKAPSITGCSLFLQVIYLDSIDLGCLNLDHNILPRIKSFGAETMKSMTLANTIADDNGDCQFGKNELRPYTEVCYSWACNQGPVFEDGKMWDAAYSLASCVGVAVEAVGPIYFAMDDNRMHAGMIHSNSGIRAMAVFNNIVQFFQMGFRYNPGAGLLEISRRIRPLDIGRNEQLSSHGGASCIVHSNGHRARQMANSVAGKLCGTSMVSAANEGRMVENRLQVYGRSNGNEWGLMLLDGCTMKFAEESPTVVYKSLMTARAMAKYVWAVRSEKIAKSLQCCFDNYICNDEMLNRGKKLLSTNAVAEDPFQLGIGSLLCSKDEGELTDFISKCRGHLYDGKPWIVHALPKYIEVHGEAVERHLDGIVEMEIDLFDCIMRRFNQLDDSLYSGRQMRRWRVFFESDFMGAILSGKFDSGDVSLRMQLSGATTEDGVLNCSILFLPALFQHRWVCYAWEVDQKRITVFDPWLSPDVAYELEHVHCRIAFAIKTAMEELWSVAHKGRSFNLEYQSVTIIGMEGINQSRINRTGSLCAQFCMYYPGRQDAADQFIDNSIAALGKLLWDAFQLKNNRGCFPDAVGRAIYGQ